MWFPPEAAKALEESWVPFYIWITFMIFFALLIYAVRAYFGL